MRFRDKLADLDEAVVKFLQHRHINQARQACEAFCKCVLLRHYGEQQGESLINGIHNFRGVASPKLRKLDLAGLISEVTRDLSGYVVIPDKNQRQKVSANLAVLKAHGNVASHDVDDPDEKPTDNQVELVKGALFELLTWLYERLLKESLPSRLLAAGLTGRQGTRQDEYGDVRGLDIVRLLYPRQPIAAHYSPKVTVERIAYDLVVIEAARNNFLAFLFLNRNATVSNSLFHFLENRTHEYTNLYVCSPKVFSTATGRDVDRLSYIRSQFEEEAPAELYKRTDFYYTDEFVWENCLAEYADTLTIPLGLDKYFVDQQLHGDSKADAGQTYRTSLDFATELADPGEKPKGVSVVVGRAGVGKTTFCEQLAQRINEQPKKRALLISSTDLRDVENPPMVRTVADLYSLFASKNSLSHAQILSPHNLEINISCGNIVLIIDGLDEIESSLTGRFDMEAFLDSAVKLHDSYRNCAIVVTSRDYYAEKYRRGSVDLFHLLGFADELVEEYLRKRFDGPSSINLARRRLTDFDTGRDAFHTPLFIALICDIIDRDEISGTPKIGITDSQYFLPDEHLDQLVFDLMAREIGKQSMGGTCDDYFELLRGLAVESRGVITRDDLDLYAEANFPSIDPDLVNDDGRFPQVYVSPFLEHHAEADTFTIKYGFVDTWTKARFVLHELEAGTDHDLHFREQLRDMHFGKSPVLSELLDVKASRTSVFPAAAKMLRKFLERVSVERDTKAKIDLRRIVSALLYLVVGDRNKLGRDVCTQRLREAVGGDKWDWLSVFGAFVSLDFTGVTVANGWFEQYDSFAKCRFPDDQVVFMDCTFNEVPPPKKGRLPENLFRNSHLNVELEGAVSNQKASRAEFIRSLATDISRVLRVGFRQGHFSWKSSTAYEIVTMSTRGLTAKSLVDYLVSKRVLVPEQETDTLLDGFVVAVPYREAAKKFVEQSLTAPSLEVVIKDASDALR